MQDGYTQVPNWLIDEALNECTPNEWQIVTFILRKTSGWGKSCDVISYSQFMKGTGIKHRKTVGDAIQSLIDKGLISRVQVGGQSFTYSIIEPVQKLNQFNNRTGTGSKNEPEPVQKMNTQKKKEKRKAAAGTASPIGDVFAAFEQNISSLTPIVAQRVGDLVDEYGEAAVMRAITEAASSNGRSVKYLESILKRWGKSGAPADGAQPGAAAASDPYQTALAHAARGDPGFTDDILKTAVRIFGWPRLQAIKPGDENYYRAEFMRIFNEQRQRIQERI